MKLHAALAVLALTAAAHAADPAALTAHTDKSGSAVLEFICIHGEIRN